MEKVLMAKFTTLSPGKTALLVIDVQQALFTRHDPVFNGWKVIETINALVARAHLFGVRVVYIQHENDSILKKDSDGWQLHPDLKPKATDLRIHKKKGNAFLGTTLQSDLEARGIKHLLITGLVTQGCVRATSLGGLEIDYNVFLVQGAHSNYNKDAESVIEKQEAELQEASVHLVTHEQIDFN
ncbi:MAG: cysteine hydrolase [Bacteroidetes bacterium]|nr:MAG: cysteine hydrolase [Bacteroidota bacterium]